MRRTRESAVGDVRRDQAHERYRSRVREKERGLGNSAHVLGAVLMRETEVSGQPLPEIVAVKTIGPAAPRDQFLFDGASDCGFA
jgi:hypothetical protein